MKITNNIKYVGVNDKEIDLFEGQYTVPKGMAYNSYAIIDEKTAIMDSVDIRFAEEWIAKIKNVLDTREPDYLVIQHMEPDHSSSIMKFTESFPGAKIVSSAKAFDMMRGFFDKDFADSRIVVTEGDHLDLGKHSLQFLIAPMVHWPEVIMSYEESEGILFSADAFGKFGALDTEEEWACEARRYYIGIVAKYGAQVQSVLKKMSKLSLRKICPLHGPVICKNLEYYLNLYDTWSSYRPESEGVCIAYTSVYGNTRRAIEMLADPLRDRNIKTAIYDLARCDIHKAVADAFRFDRLVLATTTYNGGIFPFMKEYIDHLTERGFQNRRVAFIENGSWAPMATKIMKDMLKKSKNLSFAESTVSIKSAINEDTKAQIKNLAKELCKNH